MRINFIDLIKNWATFIVIFVHFGTAFFNANGAWSFVTATPEIQDNSYPSLINFMTLFDAQWGFMVTIAVLSFFMCSAYTNMYSISRCWETKKIAGYFLKKIKRLFPTYILFYFINIFCVLINMKIYGKGFPFSTKEIISSMLMGGQYFIPNAKSIDLTIWFMGILLMYYVVSVIGFYITRMDFRGIFLIDFILCVILHYIHKFGLFGDANGYWMKSMTIVIYSLLATILWYRNEGKITEQEFGISSGIQFFLFAITYANYADRIQYVGKNEYIPWFGCAYLVFLLSSYLNNDHIAEGVYLKRLIKDNFIFYIGHGYLGYSIFAFIYIVIFSQNYKSVSIVVAFIITLVLLSGVSRIAERVKDRFRN